MNAPSIPKEFLVKLRKFDKSLGVEWLGTTVEDGHWCIIDESKIIRQYTLDSGKAFSYPERITIYDRIHHLEPGQPLNDRIIQQLWRMDEERWGRKEWQEKYLNELSGQDEVNRKKEAQDFRKATNAEVKTLKHFGVTVPGRKDCPNTVKDLA